MEASTLAIIDRQITGVEKNFTPAQYEIIRQVIYSSADLEYQSLVQFSSKALAEGAAALMAARPIIVDVPEIQVSIVPKLQQTFANFVYCCATTNSKVLERATKASSGLEILAHKYPNGIYIIGQDQAAMTTMVNLIEHQTIKPSLAIVTPPALLESEAKQKLKNSDISNIYIAGAKGGANIAAAIFNSLIQLAWQAKQKS